MRVTVTNAGVPLGTADLTVRDFREPGGDTPYASGELDAFPAFEAVTSQMRRAREPGVLCATSEGVDAPAFAPAAAQLPLALADPRGLPVPASAIVLYHFTAPPRTLVLAQFTDSGAPVGARLRPQSDAGAQDLRPDA